jgi:multicomponent Na+:H+ antiporter subunit E
MKNSIHALVMRALVFTALWSLLSENAWHDWPLVVLGVVAGVAVSFALWPVGAWQWRFLPVLRFIPYFLRESLTGGIDVARRAFSPKMPLDPGLLEFPLRLRGGAARVFFCWTVSLLPGTASVHLSEARLKVHVLDRQLPAMEKLRELEDYITALFGEEFN